MSSRRRALPVFWLWLIPETGFNITAGSGDIGKKWS